MDFRYCPRVRIVVATSPQGTREIIYQDVDRERCERKLIAYNYVMAGTGFTAKVMFHPLSRAMRAASSRSR
jgi:hypothetical protein